MPDHEVASADRELSFGPFRLVPSRQLLLENGNPLHLGSRALDILIALAERPNQVVSKEDLIAQVWPSTYVEEGNLRVHIAALRRALGDGQGGNRYIANVPGRGYRFIGPVSISAERVVPAPQRSTDTRTHDLPAPPTRMLGRDDVVNSLISQLPQRRFITLVGPGGIGKTTVALAVARKAAASYPDGVRFVDLAPLTDPLLVPSALAFVLGLAIRSDNPIPGLVAFLRGKKMLLVLDSCEHVIEAAAALAEQVIRGAPGVHILATSREAMRAEGERMQRLGPLSVPATSAGLTAVEALAYPAIQLFVERATETLDTFELTDADAGVVADVCRRLDGIALAIELAAGRVDVFGVRGLAARLDDRFRLLTPGRRTALPRHQTLAATLDWSYEALSEHERVVLRRLGVFAGTFTIEAAAAIAADPEATESNIIEPVANLVAKSLVVAEVGVDVRYRLLDTTCAYARRKINDSNELQTLTRRHAEFYLRLFERAEAERRKGPAADWLAVYGCQIDNLRAALDWAFSPRGDVALGAALTLAAVPLWFQLSLINECRESVERALAALDPQARHDDHQKMTLYAALGWSLMYTVGRERPTGAAWQTALELAERLNDVDYQLRALWGLWASCYNNGEYREALAFAERFSALAVNSADPADPHIGDRMTGVVLHFLGDQTGARKHIERMLSRYVTPVHRSDIVRFQFEQRVTARITLARVLWVQGFVDQALRAVDRNIDEAVAIGHTLSLCNALANAACPVALLAGDLTAAERYTAMLSGQTERHALDSWQAYADIFRGELLARRGHLDSGLTLLGAAIGKLRDARFAQYQTAFLGLLAENLARASRLDEGRAAINEALLQCERTEERWCMSELLRIKGKIAWLGATADAASVAEHEFLKALDWARRQQALSWELRAATSLACLWRSQGRRDDARDQLASVYGRFTEGFGTADLRAAKQLLDDLARDVKRLD